MKAGFLGILILFLCLFHMCEAAFVPLSHWP